MISRTCLLGTVAAAALIALPAGQALAQQAQTPAESPADATAGAASGDKDIVVTGSRIARRDYVSASPVFTVSDAQIARQATITVDQYLRTLPQIGTSIGEAGNNAGNFGNSSINLHNLGTTRTLVLIDGKRTVGADSASQVDVSTFPLALIKSVEIITGGATAVYGSDAVAGVVNFKLDSRFSGFKASALGGVTERGDGAQYYAEAVYGYRPAGGNGGFVVYGSYTKRDPILNTDRENSARAITTTFDAAGNAIFSPRVLNTLIDGNYNPTLTNLPTQAALNTVFGSYGVAPGTVTPASTIGFNNDNTLFSNAPLANYRNGGQVSDPYYFPLAQEALLVIPSERYSVGLLGDYEFSPHATLYGRFSYSHANLTRQLSAGNLTGNIPLSFPFIPANLRTILASRPSPTAAVNVTRNLYELGVRQFLIDSDVYQGVLGLRGEIAGDWSYDVYASRGQTNRVDTQRGGFSASRATALIAAADGGRSVCAGGFDTFGQAPIGAACIDAIRYNPRQSAVTNQLVVEGTATGSLFSLPAGNVKVAFGASYRDDSYRFVEDPAAAIAGEFVGFALGRNLNAQIDVKEVFGEIAIPILKESPLGYGLDVTLGYRYSDYSSVGGVSSYKGEAVYAPIEQVRFRGSYQRATRVPNFSELFLAPTTSNQALAEDPCTFNSSYRTGAVAGVTPASVRALCITQGIPASVIDTFNGLRTVTGVSQGNLNLRPETADTYTGGVVIRPGSSNDWFRNFSFAIDYYQIDIADAIFNTSVDPFLARCYNRNGGNPTYDPTSRFCSVFSRNAAGNVANGVSTFQNIGGIRLAGVDAQLDWGIPLSVIGVAADNHRLDLQVAVSKLTRAETQVLVTDPYNNLLGTISNVPQEVFPEWRFNTSAQLTLGNFDIGVRYRFIDSMITQAKRLSPAINSLGTPSVDYVDLNVGFRLAQFELRMGIENLGDTRAPIYSTPVSSDTNTDPNTFDTIGRRFYARVAVTF